MGLNLPGGARPATPQSAEVRAQRPGLRLTSLEEHLHHLTEIPAQLLHRLSPAVGAPNIPSTLQSQVASIASIREQEYVMRQLVVRQIEDKVVRKLKERAGAHEVSMEEEHRRILREALLGGAARHATGR